MYILIRFCLTIFLKNNIFYIKNYDYIYTIAMWYLVSGEIFENMLQVISFSVHFERILNTE